MNVHFETATESDAEELTKVSEMSFHSDIFVGGRKSNGPPGYNSIEFHKQKIKEASSFYKILHNDKIIGGFWFYKDDSEKAFLHRIFIDPAFHKKGIGLKTFAFLFQSFPEIKQWSLKTPHWNTRTLCFYKKLGFEITEKTDRFSFFAKVMNRNT